MQDEFVSTEHLLLALAKEKSKAQDVLKLNAVDEQDILKALREVRGSARVTDQSPEAKFQALEKYGIDLVTRAEQGQARSGDRPRSGNPPRDPGAFAPHEEQSRADRRTRRRQDGHRRRAGAADRAERRAAKSQEQAGDRARYGCADRRHEVSWRIRRTTQGGLARSARLRRQRHSVHRRTAHGRRCRRCRRWQRCRQSAEAGPRAGRAPLHWRDDAR